MFFKWLKQYLPRGLYGRSALILFLPIAVLQLVVIVAFSQRYFDDVTTQLMDGVNKEISNYCAGFDEVDDAQKKQHLERLDDIYDFVSFQHTSHNEPSIQIPLLDISGKVMAREFFDYFDNAVAIDTSSNPNEVSFTLELTAGSYLTITTPRSRTSARNPHQLLVWTLLTSTIITLVSFLYMRNQVKPIKKLATAADRFGRGDAIPFRIQGATEVRAAGAAFLSMRSKIERQIEQRTLMLSGVSHDLRTPLTRLKLSLSMLDGAADDEIAAMQDDIIQMEKLIDTFLDFARAEHLEQSELCNISNLLEEILLPLNDKGNIRFTTKEKSLVRNLRPQAIERMVENIVTNAKRYGDIVEVQLKQYGKSVVISIEDNGPGIAPELREKALQPFVRLDESRNQDRGSGVGLGLAIAFDTARRHGGTLRLSKSATLGGLCVEIIL